MKKEMSFVLTSCGRTKLLDRTLKSFFKYNDYDIKDFFLIEDSVNDIVYEEVKKKWKDKIKIFCNKKKLGQIKSIVDIYKKIKTPYVFHCEDDWVYTRKKFIEDSLEILKTDPKIIQVWLESKKSASRLDIFKYGPVEYTKKNKIGFRRVTCKDGWEWGHFSFRPGVKRISDYNLINGYGKFKNELDIGVKYKKLGFYTVIIEKPAVIDIGDEHHVSDPTRKWPKRRKTGAPRGIKRLWKHIKNFKF